MTTISLRLFALTLALALSVPLSAQESEVDLNQLLMDFGRTASANDLDLLVVHLNDKTTDALFAAPQKYAFRAQARGRTMFFVRGTALEDTTLDFDFRVLEGTMASHRPTVVSISKMEDGAELAEGEEFLGILAVDKLIPLRTKMVVTSGSMRAEFEFTPNVLSQLQD